MNNQLARKRIVVPLFRDYYMFEYFRFLIPQLLEDGFDVTVVTFSPDVKHKYAYAHDGLTFVEGHVILRYLFSRSGKPLQRVLLWMAGWIWVARLRKRFDFAIVPWDNKPLWYIVGRGMPSLTCHNSAAFFDVDEMLMHYAFVNKTRGRRLAHRLSLIADRVTGGRFLPRLLGQVTKHRPLELLIDRLMGFRAPNHLLGCSGALLTVTGHRIKENLVAVGQDPRKIIVVGNPGYAPLVRMGREFGADAVRRFRAELGIPEGKRVFSLFLSPSSFTPVQIDEVVTVARHIRSRVPDSFLIVKFHPKTGVEYPPMFRQSLDFLGSDLLLITEFAGDEHNARLILSSDVMVQKQSTLGFLAMLFQKPLLSYDLMDTEYSDDMYKKLDASWHVETVEALDAVLDRLDDPVFLDSLRERQRVACERYCLATDQANRRISQIIRDRLTPETGATANAPANTSFQY